MALHEHIQYCIYCDYCNNLIDYDEILVTNMKDFKSECKKLGWSIDKYLICKCPECVKNKEL